jgi:hypothetical protein
VQECRPLLMPLGDTTEFHNPYLREVYEHELAVGEVGRCAAGSKSNTV